MATALITWDLPTARVDGSPLAASDIAFVEIFDSIDGGPPVNLTNGSLKGAATSYTTGVLTVGNHVFTGVVDDTSGHVSVPVTGSVTVQPTLANPGPLTNFVVTLQA